MNTVEIIIEVPLPKEGTLEDAQVLADVIEERALTTNPTPIETKYFLGRPMVSLPKVFGIVKEVRFKPCL